MVATSRLLVLLPLLLGYPMGTAGAQTALLQCQLGREAWIPCRMDLDADGLSWQLQLQQRTYRFRHDGMGVVSMRHERHGWRVVDTRWRSDASLCWGTLCARGHIPLD